MLCCHKWKLTTMKPMRVSPLSFYFQLLMTPHRKKGLKAVLFRGQRYLPTVSAAVMQRRARLALPKSLIQNNKECARGQLSVTDNLPQDGPVWSIPPRRAEFEGWYGTEQSESALTWGVIPWQRYMMGTFSVSGPWSRHRLSFRLFFNWGGCKKIEI